MNSVLSFGRAVSGEESLLLLRTGGEEGEGLEGDDGPPDPVEKGRRAAGKVDPPVEKTLLVLTDAWPCFPEAETHRLKRSARLMLGRR